MLWTNGADVTGKTLMERRAVLEAIVKPVAGIHLGSFVEGEGKALFDLAKAKGMEGHRGKAQRRRLSAWQIVLPLRARRHLERQPRVRPFLHLLVHRVFTNS